MTCVLRKYFGKTYGYITCDTKTVLERSKGKWVQKLQIAFKCSYDTSILLLKWRPFSAKTARLQWCQLDTVIPIMDSGLQSSLGSVWGDISYTCFLPARQTSRSISNLYFRLIRNLLNISSSKDFYMCWLMGRIKGTKSESSDKASLPKLRV